jgi:FtsP/CotA-like multicopper oxidase with cupredoxin domain
MSRARFAIALTTLLPAALAADHTGPAPAKAGQAQPAAAPAGRVREHFIAADEIVWDYAPSGMNQISGHPWTPFESDFMVPAKDRIGRVYKKRAYRAYTDATFTTLAPRTGDEEILGFVGPLLRAEVGDTLRILFKNNSKFPASMHPHGVFYDKDSEGAPYQDGTAGNDKADDAVPPGATHLYTWEVRERAGPGPGDGSSVIWMYHSHANEVADVSSGLIGPMIVTRRGGARPDGSPADIDHEFVVMFSEVDENASNYHSENVAAYALDPASVPKQPSFADFYFLSNLRQTMNGFSYGHMPMPRMKVGDRVRWYMFATTGFEIHTPHWHGNVALWMHMRTDVVTLTSMSMAVADMVPDNPGIWLFHCHVGPHLDAGMINRYEVLP